MGSVPDGGEDQMLPSIEASGWFTQRPRRILRTIDAANGRTKQAFLTAAISEERLSRRDERR